MDFNKLFSLAGRVALVTGGSRGIGRMIAEGFLAAGAERVYITARKQAEVAATAAELGERCVALPGDIATLAGIEALAAELAGRETRLDILVNNAGVAWGGSFDSFPEAGWDKVMDLNVKTPFFLTQKLHALLRAGAADGAPAKVINIASVDGMRINPWETYPYQASKAALIHLTRRMAARLAGEGIIVSAIAPGMFASKMNRAAEAGGDHMAGQIPAGRIGEDEDMAGAAIYLASRAGDYVVGSTLAVDGGWVNASLPSDFVDALGNPAGH
ncbi:MAG: SDR family oxidoreductase [Sphingomonadales bacterium]|nr:SDR family oxidoreductase [Sphingomonadales bacterium]